MKGMQWVVGAVALVAFDAALIYGVRYWQAHYVPATELPSAPPARLASAGTAGYPNAPIPMQTACMDGVTWRYDPRRVRWIKLEPVLKCDVGDVRKVLRREGVIVVYPKPK